MFETQEDLKLAIEKDRENMGKRYIEVIESNYSEYDRYLSRKGRGRRVSEDCNLPLYLIKLQLLFKILQ